MDRQLCVTNGQTKIPKKQLLILWIAWNEWTFFLHPLQPTIVKSLLTTLSPVNISLWPSTLLLPSLHVNLNAQMDLSTQKTWAQHTDQNRINLNLIKIYLRKTSLAFSVSILRFNRFYWQLCAKLKGFFELFCSRLHSETIFIQLATW